MSKELVDKLRKTELWNYDEGFFDVGLVKSAADLIESQQKVINDLTGALGLAVRLVDEDIILVRPSEKEELLQALELWNLTLSKAK